MNGKEVTPKNHQFASQLSRRMFLSLSLKAALGSVAVLSGVAGAAEIVTKLTSPDSKKGDFLWGVYDRLHDALADEVAFRNQTAGILHSLAEGYTLPRHMKEMEIIIQFDDANPTDSQVTLTVQSDKIVAKTLNTPAIQNLEDLKSLEDKVKDKQNKLFAITVTVGSDWIPIPRNEFPDYFQNQISSAIEPVLEYNSTVWFMSADRVPGQTNVKYTTDYYTVFSASILKNARDPKFQFSIGKGTEITVTTAKFLPDIRSNDHFQDLNSNRSNLTYDEEQQLPLLKMLVRKYRSRP